MSIDVITPSCPTCAAALAHEPGTDQLRCRHCKTTVAIPPAGPIPSPLAFDRWANTPMTAEITHHVTSVKCENCGGTTELSGKDTAGRCPFCKTPFVNRPNEADVMCPHALVPFAIPKDKASALLSKWISSRRFAPGALKREASVERIAGVYVPCWRFNAETTTDYEGERGDRRTVSRTVTDANGNERQESQTETDWSRAWGTVDVDFRDVDVVASRGLQENLTPVLHGAKAADLRPFREEYLYGAAGETYQVGLPDGFEQAKAQMQSRIDDTIKRDIGGDEQRIHRKDTAYRDITFLLLALPVWLVAYNFGGKAFQVLIDGHQGDIKGKRPFSPWKIVLFVAVMVAIIAAIVIAIVVAKK